MKLQIKTLTQKSLVIEIEETKTVYDLKKELSLYPDVGVKPELQKLIYAGKVLRNEDEIGAYNIDVKKFLVIMILKQPMTESPVSSNQSISQQDETKKREEAKKNESTVEEKKEEHKPESKAPAPASPAAEATTPASDPQTDAMVAQIAAMGYPENYVRRALNASFNNPERAIEYLIEGIPASSQSPIDVDSYVDADADADTTMTPFEVFQGDPMFHNVRAALQENPELIEDAIQRIAETNPALLELICENQQEFLGMLIDGYEDDDDEDDEDEEGDEESS